MRSAQWKATTDRVVDLYGVAADPFTVQTNDYFFLSRWKVQGKPDEVYAILTDVPGYLRWWPEVYLAVRPLTPPGDDGLGQSYSLLTRGKLPYRLRWDTRIVETRRPYGFTIEAAGDFVGRGIWTFTEHGNDLELAFDWRLRAEKQLIKSLSFLFKPLFCWNHGWAMARGEEGLRREIASRRGNSA